MSAETKRYFSMWGIKVRGKHHVFCAYEKSNHAIAQCKKMEEKGIVCKIVEIRCVEDGPTPPR